MLEDDGIITTVKKTRGVEVEGESTEDRRRIAARQDSRFLLHGGCNIERLI